MENNTHENDIFISPSKQENSPAITVLVPICNVEKYLSECLDSLVAQTFTNFEVLCINDGSTDNSGLIIRQYMEKDSRFRIIDKNNSGYGSSMNLGIETAIGTYLAILESDDFFEPNALELLYNAATQNQADIVKANYWFYWSKPEKRNKEITVVTKLMANHVFNPLQEREILLGLPSIWTCLYRKAYLDENNVRFLETPGASFQDMGFDFKSWVAAKRAFLIEDRILHYRQDNEQSSVNNPTKTFCVCDEFIEIERYLANNLEKEKIFPYLFRKRYDSYMWNFGRLAPELRKEFLPRMVADLKEGIAKNYYNPNLFGSWQSANLRYLTTNPEKFLKNFPADATPTAKAKYYLRIGGPKAVMDAMRHEQISLNRSDT